VPAKDQYRRFKIHTLGIDDVGMIEEVLKRRLKHLEWRHPDLTVIDGGKGQVSSAFAILREKDLTKKIFLLGLAKKLWMKPKRKERPCQCPERKDIHNETTAEKAG